MKRYIKVSVFMCAIFLSAYPLMAEKLGMAQEFSLPDIYNDTVTLNRYRDKQPVLLFFWATWCPHCRKELKVLDESYAELSKNDIEVLAINVGESVSKVNNFLKN